MFRKRMGRPIGDRTAPRRVLSNTLPNSQLGLGRQTDCDALPDLLRRKERAPEAAAFILREAAALGIRVGTDGTEVVVLAPLRIPSACRRAIEDAISAQRREIIQHIKGEYPSWPPTR
jgi:hypothetical protein